jgi:hypothetical protein
MVLVSSPSKVCAKEHSAHSRTTDPGRPSRNLQETIWITADPGEWPLVLPGEFFLHDGTPAMIWPLLPTDAETLRDLFRRLSPESRQHRFLHGAR